MVVVIVLRAFKLKSELHFRIHKIYVAVVLLSIGNVSVTFVSDRIFRVASIVVSSCCMGFYICKLFSRSLLFPMSASDEGY